ncbi:MAG TPA: TAT-variant-translocated molybdopterin oxidoreductase [Blastocatellia bacterium]|nr:TAT-variant-translocated molybdopterin oxidoreductase [Blastocatellia bacterium]
MTSEKTRKLSDSIARRPSHELHSGREYWRSLEEWHNPGLVRLKAEREFFDHAAEWTDPVSRRQFLKLMGASLALAGVTGCVRQPDETIVPFVRAPEEVIPGKPLFYATTMTEHGFGLGLLVESHEGRPTKIEGNPNHPASLGATDIFAQASVLTLYDPDRSQVVLHRGRISTWEAFVAALGAALQEQRAKKGAGLRLLTETVTSPTILWLIEQVLARFPEAKWHHFEPVTRDNVRAGTRLAFGQEVNVYYRFDAAEVIVSLDGDFLTSFPGSVRYARDFASRRRAPDGSFAFNRLYVLEPAPTLSGAMADHRIPVRASDIEDIARAIAQAIGVPGIPINPAFASSPLVTTVAQIVQDLQRHRGSSLVVVGEGQRPVVHAIAHAINHTLGNVGKTVFYTDPVAPHPSLQLESLHDLVEAMAAGQVEVLLILGGNPLFTAPVDFRFAERLGKVKLRIHVGLYADETAELCHWHIPEAHYLESWGDARAFDGTASLIQPLIAPLYGGKSVIEILAVVAGQPGRSAYELVREYWRTRVPSDQFERFWQTSLHDGVIAGSAFPARQPDLALPAIIERARESLEPPPVNNRGSAGSDSSLEIVLRPDPTIGDGRYANNGWLQELPKPLTKLTWDNAVHISPVLAERLGLRNEQIVEVRFRDRPVVRGPVWIMPGQANDSVLIHFGYGRRRAGRVGTGMGFDAYRLRASDALWFGSGVDLVATADRYPLACTQEHFLMEGRNLVRAAALGEYEQNPAFARMGHDLQPEKTLYPPVEADGPAWGMVIDLSACIGCNACVVACQAENNIPIVGKGEVLRGREMHWIRIDRYFEGEPTTPRIHHQPVLCMHCENAPCEVVCPVGATVHSREGLNEMVYNRCVGTRYCSNNCPYKVRRFNFLQYADTTTPSLKLMRNPNVTVRTRGVMEKCTYCVQRINAARIQAKKEDREIRDGEIVTACQAACPTQAIVFGNIADPTSRVARLKAHPLNYGILTELNTKPRTTYLAKLRNPYREVER